MTSTKLLAAGTTVLLAIATLAAGAAPARAATPGFHAAYFSESSFLLSSPGQSGQFAVGFQNSGDQAWVKADPTKKASLHTAAPLDNINDFSAGWSVNWTAPNIYAEQLSDVAPGAVAYFIYNYVVPSSAANGPHTFYGRPFVGSTPLEDFGYYQIVTVGANATLTITSTTPASPSTVVNPTVNGNGAPAGVTVTIQDGTTIVGSGNADSAGNFAVVISVAGPGAVGTHTLVAKAPNAVQSAPFSYTVTSSSAATPAPGNATSPQVSSVGQPGTYTVIVTFTKTMAPATITAANFRWDSQTFPGIVTLQSGGTAVRLDFNANALPAPVTHALDIQNLTDTDGNKLNPSIASYRVSIVSDTNRPTMGGATAVAAQTLEVTFSESMATLANGFSSTLAVDSVSNWQLLNADGSTPAITVSGVTIGGTDNDAALFNLTKARISLSSALQNASYTIKLTNANDEAGNTISPNPSTLSFSFSGGTSLSPTLNSASLTGPTSNQAQQLVVSYSKAMSHAGSSTSTSFVTCTGSGGQMDNRGAYSSTATSGSSGTALGTAIQDSRTKCLISSDERTVTFQFDTSQIVPNNTYTLSVSSVTDSVGNTFSTNPATISVNGGVASPVRLSGVSSSSLTVVFNTAMRASGASDGTYSQSALNPVNYLVSNNPGGSYCASGTSAVAGDGTLTQFTLTCTGGSPNWNTGGLTVRVQNATDQNGNSMQPNPSVTLVFP